MGFQRGQKGRVRYEGIEACKAPWNSVWKGRGLSSAHLLSITVGNEANVSFSRPQPKHPFAL